VTEFRPKFCWKWGIADTSALLSSDRVRADRLRWPVRDTLTRQENNILKIQFCRGEKLCRNIGEAAISDWKMLTIRRPIAGERPVVRSRSRFGLMGLFFRPNNGFAAKHMSEMMNYLL
jgi:hypothetical protein